MARASAALALAAVVVAGLLLVSGGSDSDPRTPAGLPGLPPPFLGTAVVGAGGLTAAVDAYGDLVDLRPSPAGPAWLAVPAARQATGTVAPTMAIVPRLRLADGRRLPFWRADAIRQRYLPGTNVLRTTARFGEVTASVTYFARGGTLGCLTKVWGGAERRSAAAGPLPGRISLAAAADAAASRLRCDAPGSRSEVAAAADADRHWLGASAPLARSAPAWAMRLYGRSLLTLRALTDRRTGAVAAGAREGWAYVWPRDASAVAQALAAAAHGAEARRVARFLHRLDLGAAARFRGDGSPLPGRGPQGDAAGWVAVAGGGGLRVRGGAPRGAAPSPRGRAARGRGTARGATGGATGSAARGRGTARNATASAKGSAARGGAVGRGEAGSATRRGGPAAFRRAGASWRDRPDYQEKASGDYLGNAIAATALDPRARRGAASVSIERAFEGGAGLDRLAHDPGSGLDSAAAWAVRPFALAPLYPAAGATLRRMLARGGRFGIVPSSDWPDRDPWTAPTAWSAWAFAALARADRRHGDGTLTRADRRDALALLADLRRAATPSGELPERVDAGSGVPRSTTPLAWSHAFAILALRELWPSGD